MVYKIGCDALQLIEEKVLVVGLNKGTNVTVCTIKKLLVIGNIGNEMGYKEGFILSIQKKS